jgi:hypothetical protein
MVTPGRLVLLLVLVLASACTKPAPSSPSSAAPNVTPVALLEPGAYTLALCPESETTKVITVPGKGTFTFTIGLAMCAGSSNCAAPANVALQVRSVDGVWVGQSENGNLALTLHEAGSSVQGVMAGSATTVDGTARVTADSASAPQIAGARSGSQDLAGRIDGTVTFVAPSGGGCSSSASSWTLRPRQ